jgi:type IV pilus assembly protein PilM
MNSLGIYFGARLTSSVETKGKTVINNIGIPQSVISSSDLEEKVPGEVKIVTLLKDELEKNKIETNETAVALSGRDLIIRTFEMPNLSHEELNNAVDFEVRKYIPFKVEDLVSIFQFKKIDKFKRKNLVLFVGIKKETLDRYLYILSQLNLKANSIEYAAFSVLRLLKLAKVKEKGVVSVVSVDLKEEDEVNFMVLEDGFPLFSRDITLVNGPPAVTKTEEAPPGIGLEKLKKEIRISLDYYYRKFPTKKINKTFFITGQDYRTDLQTFLKEMGLDIQFIDANKYIGEQVPFSLSLIKGYSIALSRIIKATLKIDLLLAKTKAAKEIGVQQKAVSLFAGLKVKPRVVILGLFICIATFLFGLYRTIPLQRELDSIIGIRPQVSTIKPQASYEEINIKDSEYKNKIYVIDNLLKKQVYLTELLDVIRRVIPEGIWLSDFSFKKEENKTELTLRGNVYLSDSAKELELVNKFVSDLKQSPIFTKYFKQMEIVSVGQKQDQKISVTVTNFEITCRSLY